MTKDELKDLLDQAVAAHQAGQFHEARTRYEKLLDCDPENPDALYLLGGIYYQNNNPKSAAELIAKAIQSAPGRDYFYSHLALALNAMGNTDDAMDAFHTALAINPENSETYIMMGKVLRGKGQTSEAIDAFKRCIERDPENAKAYQNLGAAFESAGKPNEAADAIQKSIFFSGDSAEAHHGFGNYLLACKKMGKAIGEFETAIKKKPDFAEAYNSLGIALKSEGRVEDAIDAYKKAIAIDAKHPQTFNNLAVALNAAGKNQEAFEAYQTAIFLEPNNPYVFQNIGILLKTQGKFQEALMAFQQAATLFPEYADAYHNIGSTLIEMGQTDKALPALQRAAQLDPGNHSAKYMAAVLSGESPKSAPPEYVKELFNQYSNRFDKHLTRQLSYKTPQLLRNSLDKAIGKQKQFEKVLDLGCGTGLGGEVFRDVSGHMSGVDISRDMIGIAGKKALYHQLYVSEINEFLADCRENFDLVIAADVLVYFGDLEPLFSCLEKRLNHGACFIFSTESCPDEAYTLRSTGRFAHGTNYIKALAEKHQCKVVNVTPVVLRKEGDKPVEGEIFILLRKG